MKLPRQVAVAVAVAISFALACSGAHAQTHDQDASSREHAAMHDAQDGEQPAQPKAAARDAKSDEAKHPVTDHVPPPAPQHAMTEMSPREMTDAMEMDDTAPVTMLRFDRLERSGGNHDAATAWKLAASVGGDFDKLLVRSEGEHTQGAFEGADAEVLWSHAMATYWDTQLGVRHDFGRGAHRSWTALGVQGRASYWFELGVTAYLGDAGRTALRAEADYDLSLTQRWILQPRLEFNAYGKADPAARIGSGLSDAALGLRLRYEIRRELAAYFGVERVERFGGTASLGEAGGVDARETRWVIGLRVWY